MPRHERPRFTCSLHFRHRQLNLCLTGVLEPRCSAAAWGDGSLRYLFENYAFDTDRRELRRGAELVAIPPQVFDLLDYLIRNREHVVSKDDLIDAVWKGRIVSETALTTRLNAARSAIGDSGEKQRLIKTLPRKGFRFIGLVHEEKHESATAADSRVEPERRALALPNKPSIAVMPFENMSGDPEQEYFADGMVEEITTALSHFRQLFVIARNSSFTYKGRAVDVKQVGRELGVRYVLEGSVRKAENRVRITGQLVDTATGAHLWAERFDGALGDIFALQDQMTERVVGAIAPAVEKAEIERAKRKPTDSLDAYSLYLHGLAKFYQYGSPEANDGALLLFNRAIELDPDFASAYGRAATCYVAAKTNGWLLSSPKEVAEVASLVQRGVDVGKDDAFAFAAGGFALAFVVRDLGLGAALIDRALVLNPNLAGAWSFGGWAKVWLGEPEAAIDRFARAMRLSPLDPFMAGMQAGSAYALFFLGRYDEAASWAAMALQNNPDFQTGLRVHAASSAMAGRLEQAHEVIARLRQLNPSQRISTLSDVRGPYRRTEDVSRYEEGLRRAGLPE